MSRIHSKDAGIGTARALQYVQLRLDIMISGAHPGAADQLFHVHSPGLSVRNMNELLTLHFMTSPDETEICRLPRVPEGLFPRARQMQRRLSGTPWRPRGYWDKLQESKFRPTNIALQSLTSGHSEFTLCNVLGA